MTTTNDLIVVDVQPFYKDFCRHIIRDVGVAIEKADFVTYYYNGMEVGIKDTEDEILEMLEAWDLSHKIHFVEKGYGFFRDWMDYGVPDQDIIDYITTGDESIKVDHFDSKGIDIYDPCLYVPPLENAMICGGGDFECLKEMELYLKVHGIETERIQNAIY